MKKMTAIVLALLIIGILVASVQAQTTSIARGNQSHSLGGGPAGGGPFSSISWSHTRGANSNFLVVGIYESNFGGPPTPITSVTYGTQPMTLTVSANNTFIYHLVNPASGTNTITVTLSGTATEFGTIAQDYSGVDTVNAVDVVASQAVDTSPLTLSFTTTKDKDWAFMFVRDGTGTEVAGTNSTVIFQSGASNPPNLGFGAYDNQTVGSITPAGSFSMTVTNNGTPSMHGVMVAFSPTPTAEGDLWQMKSFQGKAFIVTTNKVAISGTAETDFFLLKNAVGSGKNIRIKIALPSFTFSGADTTIRIYKNPTIISNGTSLSVNNLRSSGGTSLTTTAFKLPVISARGTLMDTFQVTGGGFTRDFELAFFLEPGENLLVTVEPSRTGIDHSLTITLSE